MLRKVSTQVLPTDPTNAPHVTYEVLMWRGSALPVTCTFLQPVQTGGVNLSAAFGSAA